MNEMNDTTISFRDRVIVIASMHRKDLAITPVLEKDFGLKCRIAEGIDTDRFGTFSGEVERNGSPIDAARMKCDFVLDRGDTDLVIATEGSFGPHPSAFFLPAHQELILLKDKFLGIEIQASTLTTETNFAQAQVTNTKDLLAFAARAGFPEHGLILRSDYRMEKGIASEQRLLHVFEDMLNQGFPIAVETDMRAMMNPSRMKVIKALTYQLAEKMKCLCPQCSTPGFDLVKHIPGLPCEWCSQPTRMVKSVVKACQKCSFQEEYEVMHAKRFADPAVCSNCNP